MDSLKDKDDIQFLIFDLAINNEKKLLDFYQKSDTVLFNSLNEKVWIFVGLITKVNESNIKLMNELIEIYRKININEDTKNSSWDFTFE